MGHKGDWRRKTWKILLVLVVVGVAGGIFAWQKFFREYDQPEWITGDARQMFMYGSLRSESDRGIPYWVWFVLPRMFPEYLPGPGGYASLGFPWEPGKEVPTGFAQRTVGFPRITNNCAMCHATQYRVKEDSNPTILPAGPGHTQRIQDYIDFLAKCANDPRFNGRTILAEMKEVYEFSWIDQQLYRYLIIPITKKRLIEQDGTFEWARRLPQWGPGRDDPMNLTKYFMTDMEQDDSTGNADFPHIWNLKTREGQALNWGGETLTPRAVLIDSALGLGAPPDDEFLAYMDELVAWLAEVPPPAFPFEVDSDLAIRGRTLFNRYCGSCHAPDGPRNRKVIPIDEIKTDPERLDTWTQEAADKANEVVAGLGIDRKDMVKDNGYLAHALDAVWLRAPYLHNGSVWSLRDLLEPAEQRAKVFWRGYDVYDPENMGFVSYGPEAERVGWRFDTSVRGDSAVGHEYGTDLPPEDKDALVEFMKTL